LEIEELVSLEVIVDDVIYMPTLETPTDKPYPFVYFITIKNKSKKKVKIVGRKWILTSLNNDKTIVEGEGVVGQIPEISSGCEFNYNSYHVIANDSEVEGAFFGETDDGDIVYTKIPKFELSIPK
jgi:ApaG protein